MTANRYQLTRLLGRGGMAEVYEAVQRSEASFSRRVAIKRMLPSAAAQAALQRSFLDEASIASRLHHASIIGVLDYGTIDGQPFQVLELVVGLDARVLSDRVREIEGQFPEELTLYICREVAHALHYAHTATDGGRPLGIVHRDVKPSNVLVSTAGDVKLGDFGIAFAHERTEQTQAGVVKGTMSFMAPEQLLGTAQVDARADVFALGCSLHALLTGYSPLRETADVAKVVAGGTVDVAPAISPDVAALIRGATQGNREKRYASAEAFAHAITGVLATRSLPDGKHALSTLVRDLAAPDTRRDEQSAGAFDGLLLVPAPGGGTAHTFVATELSGEATAADPRTTPLRLNTTVVAPLGPPAIPPGSAAASPGATSEPRFAAAPPIPPMAEPHALAPTVQIRSPQPASGRGALAAVLGIALVLVVAAGGLIAARYLPAPAAARAATSASAAPTASVAPTAMVVASDSVVLPSSEPVAIGPVVTQTTPPAPPRERPKGTSSAAPAAPTKSAVATSTVTATEPADTGVVAVGAPSDDREAQILIDGSPRGVAPKQIALPVGTHTITLRRSDGRSLPPRSVTVLASHTSRAPLRVPAPE